MNEAAETANWIVSGKVRYAGGPASKGSKGGSKPRSRDEDRPADKEKAAEQEEELEEGLEDSFPRERSGLHNDAYHAGPTE